MRNPSGPALVSKPRPDRLPLLNSPHQHGHALGDLRALFVVPIFQIEPSQPIGQAKHRPCVIKDSNELPLLLSQWTPLRIGIESQCISPVVIAHEASE